MGTLVVDLRTDYRPDEIVSIDVWARHASDPSRNRYARIDGPSGDLERGIRLTRIDGVENDQSYDVDVRLMMESGEPRLIQRTYNVVTERRVCRRFLFFRYSCRTPTTAVVALFSRRPR